MAYDANYPADNLVIAQGPAAIRQKGADLKTLIDAVDSKKIDEANAVSSYGYHYRDVAGYSTTGSTGANTTGTLKITLPTSWLNTMLKIKVEGFNYTSEGNWYVELQGYNLSSAWANTSATLSPNCPFTSVRFGHDGTKCCILLGITSTVWQHPQITISDVYASYLGYNQYATGWALSFITNETGITMSSTPDVKTLVDATRTDVFAPAGYGLGTNCKDAVGDWDNYTTTGFFQGNNLAHAPETGTGYWFFVEVCRYDDNYVYQQAHGFSSSTKVSWERTKSSGTWSAWKKFTAGDSDTVDGKHASNFAPAGYGLGGRATPLSSLDLNTVYDIGFYFVNGNCTNQPVAGSGFHLTVQGGVFSGSTPLHFSQIAIGYNTGVTYTRTCLNGTWSAWKQIVTDVSEGFTQSLSANGWTKLPNGLIMQWGSISIAAAVTTGMITFPIAFPSLCASINATPSDTGGTTTSVTSLSTTTATITRAITSGSNVNSAIIRWFAIGY